MSQKNFTIPVFIPEMACPHQCLYCNQQKISGIQKSPSEKEIIKIVNSYLKTIPSGSKIEIGFFGGNFTGIPQHDQQRYLQLVQPYLNENRISAIRCSTRPDYINEPVLELLQKYGVKTIELGAQSMDEVVLQKSGRGHTVENTIRASEMIKTHGFKLGLQMMLGLPGDTREKSLFTAKKIIDLGAENTRIYPTLVIKDTALHVMYNDGRYSPLSLVEAVDWCAQLIPIFEEAQIKILRVGLHPSEGLITGNDLVAGPFHPSFRELVYTEIWRQQLESITKKSDQIEIQVNSKEFNYAIGYQSKNKNLLKQKFKQVKFSVNDEIKFRDFKIIY